MHNICQYIDFLFCYACNNSNVTLFRLILIAIRLPGLSARLIIVLRTDNCYKHKTNLFHYCEYVCTNKQIGWSANYSGW